MKQCWQAFDGEIFYSETECKEYERRWADTKQDTKHTLERLLGNHGATRFFIETLKVVSVKAPNLLTRYLWLLQHSKGL